MPAGAWQLAALEIWGAVWMCELGAQIKILMLTVID
jgi:hypothetical protein